MKIRSKIFFLIFSVVLFIMMGFYVITEFYLEKFYIDSKKENLKSVAQIISNPEHLLDFEQLERENNVTIYIRQFSNDLFVSSEDLYIEGLEKKGILQNIRDGKQVFQKIKIEDPVGEFMILFTPYQYNRFVEIRTPISSIKESVQVANRYYMRIIAYALGFGLIMAFVFSKKITQPILHLKEITKGISNLNFSMKFSAHRKDEIGELGNSINRMGDILYDTIDDLNAANLELKKDIEREKKLESLRKEFVASVSHELKTPITLIQGYAQGLMEGIATDEDRNFYCGVIVDESRKMDELVKELLLISQIEAGYLELDIEKINLGKMIRQVMDKYYMEFEKYDISYPEYDIWALGDWKYIKRVLGNLVSNAFKYTPENGKIKVEVDEDGEKYRVKVINRCSDLTEEDLEELWAPFYRGDKSRSSEGTGLGLAIVKGVLEKHKSSYGAELEAGRVIFWFDLDKAI
ncbi:HAMP domain-containing sensor histidine kinase [uncultured Ilyobacter sp.]|uniref:sensor histidine kinase n=1 Tax=uncultured Ilyobacter sp. TaxID=544433 RepID=UPI0029F55E85|nr:HAMP domain-containing sensor histidine kinase [uncultured Ilyobacter sp.]